MKYLILILLCFGILPGSSAQSKNKQKNKTASVITQPDQTKPDVTEKQKPLVYDPSAFKERKNIPAKVENGFKKDFPGAGNIVWKKMENSWFVEFFFNGVKMFASYTLSGEQVL